MPPTDADIAPARDEPRQAEEDAAADQVEGEDLAQRVDVHQHAVQAEPDQRGTGQPGDRRRGVLGGVLRPRH